MRSKSGWSNGLSVVVGLLGLAVLGGCTGSAGPTTVEVRATVRKVAPPTNDGRPASTIPKTVAETVAPLVTTVVTTVVAAPTTRSVPAPPGITDPQAVIDAAILSYDQRQQQVLLPADKRNVKAITAATPEYADALLKTYRDVDAANRRSEQGSINDRVPLRIEEDSKGVVVVICTRNNGSEFDTKGTSNSDDDTLVQNDLVTRLQRIEMTFRNGRWLAQGHRRLEAGECANVFS